MIAATTKLRTRLTRLLACALSVCLTADCRAEVRLKDITVYEGADDNVLEGLGLVVGLQGTGGDSAMTREMLSNYLQNSDLRSDPATRALLNRTSQNNTDNISAVAVSATLPAFRNEGRIDVRISTLDEGTSLQGGTLLMTPLYGADGEVYAVAGGAVTIGGFGAQGDAASVQKNQLTVGHSSATIQRATPAQVVCNGVVRLHLTSPDFGTSSRVAQAINAVYPQSAMALDAAVIEVAVPESRFGFQNEFLAEIENLTVVPDAIARIVINENTGTVVIGDNVRISRVAITHGGLSIITTESPVVSQPLPFSDGETSVQPRTELDVMEERNPITVIEPTVTVGELAQALNAMGVTPRDLMSILQALQASGALHAEIITQ